MWPKIDHVRKSCIVNWQPPLLISMDVLDGKEEMKCQNGGENSAIFNIIKLCIFGRDNLRLIFMTYS